MSCFWLRVGFHALHPLLEKGKIESIHWNLWKLYQNGKIITEKMCLGGRGFYYGTRPPSPTFEGSKNVKEGRFRMNKTVFIFDKPLEKVWKRIYSTWEINNKYQFLKNLQLSHALPKNTFKTIIITHNYKYLKTLILNTKWIKLASTRVVQIMTNFWYKTRNLDTKTRKFAPARVAQTMTNFWRQMLILSAKTYKFGPARVAQIMTNFWR